MAVPARRGRMPAAGPLTALLVLSLAAGGCTGTESPRPAGRAGTPASEPPATLEPRPAPARVRVTRVAGELPGPAREVLARRVGTVVTRYFDDAFLGGDYPRSDFGSAFATFTPGARKRARGDRDLLTNRRLGPVTQRVVPRRQAAYLSVLAPHRVAAGVTARVDLRYLVLREDGADREIRIAGRLLLTRDDAGGWVIFGYDLNRASVPAPAGGAR